MWTASAYIATTKPIATMATDTKSLKLLGRIFNETDRISIIRREDRRGNLSSAIRLFVLDHYRAQADARRSAEGPIEKGHPVRSGRP